jgi:hypothetical protein
MTSARHSQLNIMTILEKAGAGAIEYIRVELKLCEICGRAFTREVGSGERGCKQHRGAMRPRAARELPIQLTPEVGRHIVRRARIHLAAELAKHIREVSAFDARSSALADACELVDKLVGAKAHV